MALFQSPRSRFQSSGDNVKKHRDMIDLPEFQRGIDFALLEYQRSMAINMNPQSTTFTSENIAMAQRLAGAQEFIHVLRELAEPAKVAPAPPPAKNLVH